ncbi:MAG TPA: protein-L-isoaspartate(D-aspartate) O-methyltransferase [Paraburkholderia sp.]|nr:protein-L-isoaspartate(D-aspartate) O-methyltransferase [Paraburkholderia sp.]
MTSERARRFPLGLADLVREPRRPEGRAGELRAANPSGSETRSRGARAPAAGKSIDGKPASIQPANTAKPAREKPAAAKPAITQSISAKPVVVQAAGVKPASVKAAIAKPVIVPAATVKPASVKPGQAKPGVTRPTTTARPANAKPVNVGQSNTRPAQARPERSTGPNVALNSAMSLTSERVRERMVERLRANGVTDQRVLNALATVPRHMFVDPGLATQAYEDAALPIGHHQTISKPSVVARMIELAAAGRPLASVLEIGTGCGYQAAVLSQVARDVYSIERIKPLYERAKTNLRPLRIPNIRLHYGDGRLGLPAAAPFDAIVIAAAGLDVPQALLEQLAIGGRLVAPVGSQEGQSQVLTLVERTGPAQWRESRLDRVFFVPLKSGVI